MMKQSLVPGLRSLLLSVFYVLLISLSAGAQCTECAGAQVPESDFCYEDPRFADLCAAFGEGQDQFVLVHAGQTRSLRVRKAGDFDGLLELVRGERPDISGLELLFVAVALQAWEQAARDLGMQFSESGLGIKIIEPGSGPVTQKGQTVAVHYTGTLEDGRTFDSSLQRGEPLRFVLGSGRVIRGWDEGLTGLAVGTRARFKIPPQLGYGSQGAGNVIPPDAVLYFEIEIVAAE
jgi:hypothetical protein